MYKIWVITSSCNGSGVARSPGNSSIHVNASVVGLGLAVDGSVNVPENPYQVAWYELGPRPRQQGSAVISGHFGPRKSGAHSVFDDLHLLKQ